MRVGIIVSALHRHGYTRAQGKALVKRFPGIMRRCNREEHALEDLLEADGHNCPCDVSDVMFCVRLREPGRAA